MSSKYFKSKMSYAKRQQVTNRRDADKLVQSAHRAYMLIGLMTLHNDFGFGSKRLEKFAEAWNENLKRFNSGELKLDGVERIMSESYGIEYKLQ